jgi:hypothetical protein
VQLEIGSGATRKNGAEDGPARWLFWIFEEIFAGGLRINFVAILFWKV